MDNKRQVREFLALVNAMNDKLNFSEQVNYSDFQKAMYLIVEENETLKEEMAYNEALEREIPHLNSQTVDSIETYTKCENECAKKRGRKKKCVNINEIIDENEN